MKQNRTKKIAIIFLLNAIEDNINLRYTNDDDDKEEEKSQNQCSVCELLYSDEN